MVNLYSLHEIHLIFKNLITSIIVNSTIIIEINNFIFAKS